MRIAEVNIKMVRSIVNFRASSPALRVCLCSSSLLKVFIPARSARWRRTFLRGELIVSVTAGWSDETARLSHGVDVCRENRLTFVHRPVLLLPRLLFSFTSISCQGRKLCSLPETKTKILAIFSPFFRRLSNPSDSSRVC